MINPVFNLKSRKNDFEILTFLFIYLYKILISGGLIWVKNPKFLGLDFGSGTHTQLQSLSKSVYDCINIM